MTDPDSAVAGAHEDGAVATGDDRAGRRRAATPTRPRWASKTATGTPQRCVDTPGAPSAARMRRRTCSVGSDQEKSRSPWRPGPQPPRRRPGCSPTVPGAKSGVGGLGHHLVDQRHGGVGHRPVVEVLLRGASGSSAKVRDAQIGPASISSHRLQGGDTPDGLRAHDRPVQGRRAAIALRSRVDHDRGACVQTSSGTRSRRNGQITRSGRSRPSPPGAPHRHPPVGRRPRARPRAARSRPVGSGR